MPETVEEFGVHRFVQDLFEDLNLTLPSLGCTFEGFVTWNALTGQGSLQRLRNKLFLYFADLATQSATLSVRCQPSVRGTALELDFLCNPFGEASRTLPAWDPELFQPLAPPGSGFCLLVPLGSPPDLGPPLHWERLSELYGGPAQGRQVLDQFVARSATLMDDLASAIRAGDANTMFRAAHTLKGSALGVTAQGLAEAALQLEMRGRRGELESSDDLYKALRVAYDEFVAWVRKGQL